MSEHVFYSTDHNYHHRELTIVNAALLVSKPPTKEKRIRIKVRMILSGQAVTGAPDWISSHHSHVATWHDPVSPAVSFSAFDLHFSAQNLFDNEGVKAPRCQMRSFEIHECGDSEAPDIAMTFAIYCPFSTAVWQWLGQFGGDTCWCSFTPGVPSAEPSPSGPDDQPRLTSGEDEDEDDDIEDPDGDDIDEDEIELDPDNEMEPIEQQEDDTVLADAMTAFEAHGKVSAVELQRVLSISYVKAAHIIDKLEDKGMVSKADENGVRSLLASQEKPQKSGPKDLAAYHEKALDAQAAGAVKRGRGRPRKVAVDPLTVDAATAF